MPATLQMAVFNPNTSAAASATQRLPRWQMRTGFDPRA
jgi:hypothetical protein